MTNIMTSATVYVLLLSLATQVASEYKHVQPWLYYVHGSSVSNAAAMEFCRSLSSVAPYDIVKTDMPMFLNLTKRQPFLWLNTTRVRDQEYTWNPNGSPIAPDMWTKGADRKCYDDACGVLIGWNGLMVGRLAFPAAPACKIDLRDNAARAAVKSKLSQLNQDEKQAIEDILTKTESTGSNSSPPANPAGDSAGECETERLRQRLEIQVLRQQKDDLQQKLDQCMNDKAMLWYSG